MKLFLLCIFLGLHPVSVTEDVSMSGMIFTQEEPVAVATAMENVWIFIPYPIGPSITPERLDQVLTTHWNEMHHLWHQEDEPIVIQKRLMEDAKDLLHHIEHELQHLRRRVETLVENAPAAGSRGRRFLVPVAAGATLATILEPAIEKQGCKLLSVFGLCHPHKALDVQDEFSRLNERVDKLSLSSGETVQVLTEAVEKTSKNLEVH